MTCPMHDCVHVLRFAVSPQLANRAEAQRGWEPVKLSPLLNLSILSITIDITLPTTY